MLKALEGAPWKFCWNCAIELVEDGIYCHKCGNRVKPEPTHAGQTHSHEEHMFFLEGYIHPIFCTRCGGKMDE